MVSQLKKGDHLPLWLCILPDTPTCNMNVIGLVFKIPALSAMENGPHTMSNHNTIVANVT